MSRGTLAVDRLATVLLALICMVSGVLGFLWWRGTFDVTRRADMTGVRTVLEQPWWPWVALLAGLLLIVLGLRWLLGHLPRRGVDEINLDGSGQRGRLRAAAKPVAEAAAEALAAAPGVRSSRGSVIRERGQVVARLTCTVDPGADLSAVAAAADRVAADLAGVLGRDDLHCQVQLKVGPAGSGDRVR